MQADECVLSALGKHLPTKNEREIGLSVLLGLSWSQTGGGWLHIFCAFFGIYLFYWAITSAVKEIFCKIHRQFL